MTLIKYHNNQTYNVGKKQVAQWQSFNNICNIVKILSVLKQLNKKNKNEHMKINSTVNKLTHSKNYDIFTKKKNPSHS